MTRYGGIRLGDSHSGGGVMLEASGFPVGGKRLCLIGDHAYCPTHNGSFPLVSTGNPFGFSVNGRQGVYEPAKLACGCSVFSSCRDFFAWVDESDANMAAATNAAMIAGGAYLPHIHDEQFQLITRTGRPIANTKYKIVSSSGRIVTGTTDFAGKTERVETSGSEDLRLYLVS